MRLTFLGTGTSTGVPILGCECAVCSSKDIHDKRTRPSLLLEFGERLLVIDTAPDFRFQALRQNLRRVDALVFTHAHADHVLGLDDVRPYYFHQKQPIPLYADERCLSSLRRMFPYIFDPTYPYGGILKVSPRLIEGPFSVWGEELIPLPVFHGDLPVLGFKFRKAAYVTDFSEIPEETMSLLEGLDLLILDALRPKPHPTHSHLEHSLALVEKLKPARALFTHIAHEMAHAATNASLPPHVQLAHDGLKVEL
jgi:phosphoribosyl 1,2-cyclic phosphate phosphodiesterase